MRDAFSSCHPAVSLLFFTLVIGCAMLLLHPVCLAVSFVWALTYSLLQNGRKTAFFILAYLLPMMAVTALLNPVFTHQGKTVLTYINNNPLTLESIYYGFAAAFMLACVVIWFSCFNRVMTSDKLVYMFGRVIPALSLVLSMALRLVPRFRAQIKVISNAQRCIGRDVRSGGPVKRAKHGIKILSIMVTWALENAIETADSMKSRGYGLTGRTAFSIFRFGRRDRNALIFLIISGACVVLGALMKGYKFTYYPSLQGADYNPLTISLFAAYFILCSLPVLINLSERMTRRTNINVTPEEIS